MFSSYLTADKPVVLMEARMCFQSLMRIAIYENTRLGGAAIEGARARCGAVRGTNTSKMHAGISRGGGTYRLFVTSHKCERRPRSNKGAGFFRKKMILNLIKSPSRWTSGRERLMNICARSPRAGARPALGARHVALS
ncbi:hypothetical protein EVAR_103088_1 [Eumeta japonica]|uniref:Uncharacterized protein n=1 Tax=Eumeta variegata TaxID=151549 RepID=A0A4C1WNS7_EUMVA|nr:hypothetical protein EVAR_103088_1 [Eumeta japonica]